MGVLDGIKVLELARVPPAEMPGMIMADMGADVLKIETPEPDRVNDELNIRRTIHAFVNRNKRSMTLNMKSPEGQAVFRKLAAGADVIVEGFRPGVMDRLGAGYQAIRELNPRIIYCSLSGFGQDGPYRNYPAHDMNYLSLAGVLNLIGDAGSKKPVIPLNLVADYAGASLHGALGIALALFARERTGRGQQVDISYLDTTLSLLAATPNMRFFFSDGVSPRRGEGFLGGTYPYYAIYETRDGKLLTIGCTEPWLWENFCKAIGRPDFAQFARKPDQFVRAANRRGGGGPRRDRGGHPHARPRRLVRVPGQARRVRGQGLRDRGDGARSADQSPGHDRRRRAPHPRPRAPVRRRHQALRDAGHGPHRRPAGRRAHRGDPEGSRAWAPTRSRVCASGRSSNSRPRAVIAERWRQLTLLSLAELLALSLWFSASAVLPALAREWSLTDAGSAGLTIAVQLGFIAGTLVAAVTNLPDVWPARRLMAASAAAGRQSPTPSSRSRWTASPPRSRCAS